MAVKRYGVEIVAEMAKFRAEIQKTLPNATAKATDAAALQMAKRFARMREAELKAVTKTEQEKIKIAQKLAAKAASARIADQRRAADRAAGGARPSQQIDSATQSLGRLEDTAGEADSIIAALGGALGQLDPRLEAITRVGADAAGGLEAVARAGRNSASTARMVGVAFGTAAVAAGVFSLAQAELERRTEAAEEAQAQQARTAERAGRVFGGLSSTLGEVNDEYAVLIEGEDRFAQQLDRTVAAMEAERMAAIRLSQERIKGHQKRIEQIDEDGQVTKETVIARDAARAAIDRERAAMSALNRRVDDGIEKAAEIIFEKKAEAQARKGAAAATNDEADAAKRLRQEQEAGDRLRRKMIGDMQTEGEARDRLRQIAAAAASDMLTDQQRIEESRDRQLAGLDEIIATVGMTAEAEAAARAITARADRELDELGRARAREADKTLTDKRAKETAAAEQKRAEDLAALESGLNVASSAAGNVEAIASALGKGNKTAFKIAKAAAIAQIPLNAAAAFARTIANMGYPVGLPFAALAAGTVIAKGAALQAASGPSFDTGGMVRGGMVARQSDAVAISALPGEGVLSTTGMAAVGGEGGLARMNRGAPPQGRPEVVPAPWRHFGAFWGEVSTGYGRVSGELDRRVNQGQYVGKR